MQETEKTRIVKGELDTIICTAVFPGQIYLLAINDEPVYIESVDIRNKLCSCTSMTPEKTQYVKKFSDLKRVIVRHTNTKTGTGIYWVKLFRSNYKKILSLLGQSVKCELEVKVYKGKKFYSAINIKSDAVTEPRTHVLYGTNNFDSGLKNKYDVILSVKDGKTELLYSKYDKCT